MQTPSLLQVVRDFLLTESADEEELNLVIAYLRAKVIVRGIVSR